MATPSMLWDEIPPAPKREVLSHFGVSIQGIGFNFVEEAIAAPTDWCFQEDHHVIVVHRNGKLRSMDSEFQNGPSGQVLPEVGDIWVIPAGERYAALAQGDTVGFCEMKIPTHLLHNEAILPRMGHRDEFLRQAMDRLALLGDREDDLAQIMRETLGETVRLHLLDAYAPVRSGVDDIELRLDLSKVQQNLILQHINDQLDANHSLAQMASLLGLSVSDFLASFSTSFGTTPHQYVIWARIQRAKELLVATKTSITEIALAAGFSTPSHFATSFRQSVGMTPSAYRQAGRRKLAR